MPFFCCRQRRFGGRYAAWIGGLQWLLAKQTGECEPGKPFGGKSVMDKYGFNRPSHGARVAAQVAQAAASPSAASKIKAGFLKVKPK